MSVHQSPSVTAPTQHYAIYRHNRSPNNRGITWIWLVILSRQGKRIARSFPDGICGGEQSALALARAYRDVVIGLLPPFTQRQLSTRLSTRNRSGTAGVIRGENRGVPYWIANFTSSEGKLSKSFNVHHHGEDKAKEMASAARSCIQRGHSDYFLTGHRDATDVAQSVFSGLLQPKNAPVGQPLEIIPGAVVDHLIDEVNTWFDLLRPTHVRVFMQIYPGKRHKLMLIVSDGGWPARAIKKSLSLDARSLDETLPLAWYFVRESLLALYGEACWSDFEARHEMEFFAYAGGEAFKVWYRYDRPERARLLQPPASLALHLPGFKIQE